MPKTEADQLSKTTTGTEPPLKRRAARPLKVKAGPRPRIGFHAPIAGGLQNALLKARRLGADTVQIFSRNPRGWQARPLTDEEVAAFKSVRQETAITPVRISAKARPMT